MNRAYRFLTIVFWAATGLSGLNAQETVTPLFGNPPHGSRVRTDALKRSAFTEAVSLPFFDDFSNASVVPDTGLWSDRHAFVNNSFPVDPVSNGVATLDGVDSDGSIYPDAVISPDTYEADRLTSKRIQLDYPVSDSIYLSFFFQPGGRGDLPEARDSLILDFYDPALEAWVTVWSVPGDSMQPFRQVMIPVTGERYLKEGFRFRFRNLVSLPANRDYPDMRSNVDFWHLDYIRLDRNRFHSDTVLRDVAFTSPVSSLLKDLTSLPWSQFQPAYNTVLNPSLRVEYRNNDTIPRNITRSLTILEPYYGESYMPGTPTAQDVPPQEDTLVEFGYIYPIDFERGDSALLRFKAALRTDEFDPKVNDTVVRDHRFTDYWAYDDGTPEAGYGLRGQGTSNGSVAILYRAYQPDLLGGVDVYFNHVLDSLNLDYYFKLMVWNASEGIPASVLHEDENDHTPQYVPGYTGFKRYRFSSPVPVDGPFFVGWRQYNRFMLNVGLDVNKKAVPKVTYYNYQGEWKESQAPGVLLFRPFLYDETAGNEPAPSSPTLLKVYPNPASDRIRLDLPGLVEPGPLDVRIYDLSGRLADSRRICSGSLDVSGLEEGIYIISTRFPGHAYHSKLLIQR